MPVGRIVPLTRDELCVKTYNVCVRLNNQGRPLQDRDEEAVRMGPVTCRLRAQADLPDSASGCPVEPQPDHQNCPAGRLRGPEFFQQALTSRERKIRPKTANIAGLQLADILGHPVKQCILRERGLLDAPPTKFAADLLAAAAPKFNRQLYEGRVWGYGKVFYPRGKEQAP